MISSIPIPIALAAYAQGYFPMAESKDSPQSLWVRPKKRGIIYLDQFHIPRKLAQKARHMKGKVFYDRAFKEVLEYCATLSETRVETWINDEILDLYMEFYAQGYAHSIEYWENDTLLGGLYGLHIGGIFFGESMFSIATNTSKFCLIHLVAQLILNDFLLLDTQFFSEHLSQFGSIEVDHEEFSPLLEEAIHQYKKLIFNPLTSFEALEVIKGRQKPSS